jgi:hypothetical protein
MCTDSTHTHTHTHKTKLLHNQLVLALILSHYQALFKNKGTKTYLRKRQLRWRAPLYIIYIYIYIEREKGRGVVSDSDEFGPSCIIV